MSALLKRRVAGPWALTALAVVCSVSIFVLWPHGADAQNIIDLVKDPANLISNILISIVGFLGKLLVQLINILISVAKYNNFSDSTAIDRGWVILRDLGNIFFVIVLLVIAFATILKIENYRYNRLLGRLIIMAVLVNFSRLIAGVFIDFTQIIMLTFVSAFQNAAAGNLAQAFGLTELLNLSTQGTGQVTSGEIMTALILANVMLLISLVVVGIVTLVLIMRILALWLLVVLSPIAYIARTFPLTERYSRLWWSNFGKYTTSGPIMAFFLWLTFTIVATGGSGAPTPGQYGFESPDTAEVNPSVDNQGLPGSISSTISEVSDSDSILSFIIAISLLIGSLTVTSQLGVAGGRFAGEASERVRRLAGRGAVLLGAAGVAGAPGLAAALFGRQAIRGTQRVASGGIELAKGAAYRKFLLEKPALQPLSREFWQGYAKRAARLKEDSATETMGRGREFSEWVWKEHFGRKENVRTPWKEIARGQVVAKMSRDAKEEFGPSINKEDTAMAIALRGYKVGGLEGERAREFVASLAGSGSADDMQYAFLKEGLINDVEGDKGHWKNWGFDNWDQARNMSDPVSVRRFWMKYLHLDAKKFDPLLNKDYKQNAIKASDDEKYALNALYEMTVEALMHNGHVEQVMAAKDPKSDQVYVMDYDERRKYFSSTWNKKENRDAASMATTHLGRNRMFDPTTKGIYIETNPETYSPDAVTYMEDLITPGMRSQINRTQGRFTLEHLADEQKVGSEHALFTHEGKVAGETPEQQKENYKKILKAMSFDKEAWEFSYGYLYKGSGAAGAKALQEYFSTFEGEVNLSSDEKKKIDTEVAQYYDQKQRLVSEEIARSRQGFTLADWKTKSQPERDALIDEVQRERKVTTSSQTTSAGSEARPTATTVEQIFQRQESTAVTKVIAQDQMNTAQSNFETSAEPLARILAEKVSLSTGEFMATIDIFNNRLKDYIGELEKTASSMGAKEDVDRFVSAVVDPIRKNLSNITVVNAEEMNDEEKTGVITSMGKVVDEIKKLREKGLNLKA